MSHNDKVLGEVATTKIAGNQWVLKFDGSFTENLEGMDVVLYHSDEETVVLSFKLEYP